jgi:LytS/YehU family sensor histidine kinase
MVFSLLFGGIWYISRQFCYIVIDAIKVGFANIDLKFIIDAVFYNHDSNIAKGVFFSTWPFLVWSIFYFSIKFLFTIVQEREKSTNAILLANKAQLQMLRYQINPHFLFNSLNSIKALTTENPELAGFMLTELAEFLRSTLNYNDRIYISVAEEIDIIGKYLSIEKIRFEERLDFKITYDEHIQKQEMPCFITQPLVENAIMHGLSKNPIGIMLNIDFKINDGFLVITIENTGVKGIKEFNNGTGIKNIIERLENMYPGKFRFDLTESNNIVKAQLQIPVTS